MEEAVPVRVPVQVRWRDMDALGHVNNAVYVTYLELARIAYVRALVGADAQIDRGTPLPVGFQFILAEVNLKYRYPATLGDQLVVHVWVSSVGRKSWVFDYRITDENAGRLFAEGCTTQVWYDYAAGASRSLPEEVIFKMEQLQGSRPIPRN
jgi:acyl-CoA thioester hydrolase